VKGRCRASNGWAGVRSVGLPLLVWGLLAVLFPGTAAPAPVVQTAQQPPRAAEARQPQIPKDLPQVPPTRLGLELLAHSPVVLVVRVSAARAVAAGSDLLTATVLERMRGVEIAVGQEVLVLSAAGQFVPGTEELLFLRPWRGGGRFECVSRVSALQDGYERGLGLVRRSLWLCEIREAAARVEATLEQLLTWMCDRDARVRAYALGELRWMALRQRWVWSAARLERLRLAGRACAWPEVAAGVESVASALSSPASQPPPVAIPGQSPR